MEGSWLKEEHEGIYNLIVQVGYGASTLEQRVDVPLKLIVDGLKPHEPDPPEVIEEEDQTTEEESVPTNTPKREVIYVIEPGRYSPRGVEIPRENIKQINDYLVIETGKINARTGSEPIPTFRSINTSGLVTIDWDKRMQQPLDL